MGAQWARQQLAQGKKLAQDDWAAGQYIVQDQTEVKYVRGPTGWVPSYLAGRSYIVIDESTGWKVVA